MSTRDTISLGQIEVCFLLEAANTGGHLSMFEFTVPAGAKRTLTSITTKPFMAWMA